MLSTDHLSLRWVQVRGAERWSSPGQAMGFVFATEGSGTCRWPSGKQPLQRGDVLVFNQKLEVTLEKDAASDRLTFCYAEISFDHLLPLFAAKEIQFLRNVIEGLRGVRFHAKGEESADHCHALLSDRSAKTELERRAQVLKIAASVLALELSRAQTQKDGYITMEEHLNQCLEALSVDDLLSLSVGELSKRFGCSRRHLNRLFHQHFGLAVATLRMEMRLLKAVTLLRDPTLKIIPVAEQCGFNHLGLFNTCFKRRFGITPGQWRKQAQQPARLGPVSFLDDKPICRMFDNGLCPWHCKTGKQGTPLIPAPGASNGGPRNGRGAELAAQAASRSRLPQRSRPLQMPVSTRGNTQRQGVPLVA